MMQAHGIMGLDAMTPGEADLAVGLDRLRRWARQADITLLCANLTDRRGRPVGQPHELVEAGGVKVGLLGVLQPPPPPGEETRPPLPGDLRTQDPRAAARRQVKALRRQGAEVIVMLAHTGLEAARELAAAVDGVHLVVVGHGGSRTLLPQATGGAPVVGSGSRGQHLGHAELRLAPGWSPDDRLTDDTARGQRFRNEYRELAAASREVQAAGGKGAAEEMTELARQVREINEKIRAADPPAADHLLVHELIPLDDTVPDHPAVSAAAFVEPQADEEQPDPGKKVVMDEVIELKRE
jgi:2',3'-cyclic-nucleotide 2'-phosphodiesterase (5'-nucleotidase family)